MSAPTGTRGGNWGRSGSWTRGTHWDHHGTTPPPRGVYWD